MSFMSLKRRLLVIFLSITVLIVTSLVVFLQILKNEKIITAGEIKRYQSYLLADELRQSSDDLTRMARTYVVTGESRFREYFEKILNIRGGKVSRPEKYHGIYWDFVSATGREPRDSTEAISLKTLMKKAEFTTREFNLLREAEINSNDLVHLENQAMNAMIGLYQDQEGNYTKRASPDQELAMQLLHGAEYHKAKGKIMKPLEEFFDSIDRRTREEIAFYQAKKSRLSLVLGATMILSVLLVFISLFLVMGHFKGESGVHLRELYGLIGKNLWAIWPFILFSSVVVFMIVSFSWWFFMETSSLARENLKRNMNYDLNATYNSIVDWVEQMNLETTFLAEMIVHGLKVDDLKSDENRSTHGKLKKSGILNSQRFNDYVLTDKHLTVVSSSHEKLIGEKFEVPDHMIDRMKDYPHWDIHIPQRGQTHFLVRENILFSSTLKGKTGFLFLLASPKKYLTPVFSRSFSGETGEVYMVNSKGQFISEVRWVDELIERGWLKSEKDSLMGVRVSQTGRQSHSPLIQSVSRVILGEDNEDMVEYENYLGNRVLGLWRWNDNYGFGVISEISTKEAYGFLKFYKNQTVAGTSVTVILILILTAFFVWSRLKVTKINKELGESYKTIKIQNEKLANDLIIGQKVQMDMLPDKIEGQGFQLDAYLNPAQIVSGDFYDFSFFGNEKKIYFCIGDVSGKGVGAALFMSMAKVSLHKTLDSNKGVGNLVSLVNKELTKNNTSCMFVTLIVGVMDIKTGRVHITNAGHNPPYLKKADGSLVLLDEVNGPMVGAFDDVSFKEQSIDLSPGDMLFFYTDGVTEAQNSREEFYEESRLHDLLKKRTFPTPRHMIGVVTDDVMNFIGDAKQFDDITILSLGYFPGQA